MQGQGRAERGWHTFPNEDLVAQLDGRRFDLRRGCACGVLKNTMESGGLPTCDSRARMRTACSSIERAATAPATKPLQMWPNTRDI